MTRWFMLNYDRHGGMDWCISLMAKDGRIYRKLTRGVIVRVPVRGRIGMHKKIRAALEGRGSVHWTRERTVID